MYLNFYINPYNKKWETTSLLFPYFISFVPLVHIPILSTPYNFICNFFNILKAIN